MLIGLILLIISAGYGRLFVPDWPPVFNPLFDGAQNRLKLHHVFTPASTVEEINSISLDSSGTGQPKQVDLKLI